MDFTKSRERKARCIASCPEGYTYAKGMLISMSRTGFIVRGLGCHVWDVDGNEFIEYGMAAGVITGTRFSTHRRRRGGRNAAGSTSHAPR